MIFKSGLGPEVTWDVINRILKCLFCQYALCFILMYFNTCVLKPQTIYFMCMLIYYFHNIFDIILCMYNNIQKKKVSLNNNFTKILIILKQKQ
jgi:hypothetical protein